MSENNLVIQIKKSRLDKLYEEIQYAVNQTTNEELKSWGLKSALILIRITGRRAKGLLYSIIELLKFTTKEINNLINAFFNDNFINHVKSRGMVAGKTIKEFSKNTLQFLKNISFGLLRNPKEEAPKLAVVFFGFLLGSGGLDGDGGIPDTDLKAGIGFHRSILTHSILPAIVIESIAFSLVGLVNVVHKNLPKNHDPFWDQIKTKNEELTTAFVQGTCAGIAYHLLVDMNPTAEHIKPYADLPFETTMEGHQAIFGTNAVVEIIDLDKKGNDE